MPSSIVSLESSLELAAHIAYLTAVIKAWTMRVLPTMPGKTWRQKQPLLPQSRVTDYTVAGEFTASVHSRSPLSRFYSVYTPGYRMVTAIAKVGLPSTAQPLGKGPHRHTQKCLTKSTQIDGDH